MQVSLFTPATEEGRRYYVFEKTIEIDFLPSEGSKYYDQENKRIYHFTAIYFSETKVCAVASKLDESRADAVSEMFQER